MSALDFEPVGPPGFVETVRDLDGQFQQWVPDYPGYELCRALLRVLGNNQCEVPFEDMEPLAIEAYLQQGRTSPELHKLDPGGHIFPIRCLLENALVAISEQSLRRARNTAPAHVLESSGGINTASTWSWRPM